MGKKIKGKKKGREDTGKRSGIGEKRKKEGDTTAGRD